MMEAEAVLDLFDSCWFGNQNLKEHPSSSTSTNSHENLDHEIKEEPSEPMFSHIQSNHSRSMSDHLSSMTCFNHDSLSPDSVLFSPKLQTILSGKDVTDTESQFQHQVLPKKNIITSKGNRRKKRQSKSLSDLEFEELKGFMDLGFVFSEEDKDSTLASIIPGLQRLGKSDEEEEDCDESAIQRPYLSEAWKVQEKRKKENPLMNWKVPALNNEIDMKDSLRWWAHTVASTLLRSVSSKCRSWTISVAVGPCPCQNVKTNASNFQEPISKVVSQLSSPSKLDMLGKKLVAEDRVCLDLNRIYTNKGGPGLVAQMLTDSLSISELNKDQPAVSFKQVHAIIQHWFTSFNQQQYTK
ncbi:hypothetical protein VNO77_44452 [Canavalia gladiata]|uniref:Uncharacterized protein n=1 Tax=Canavalia gladiata TaxID=3824 RepID=A0AAN9JW05_CANGL